MDCNRPDTQGSALLALGFGVEPLQGSFSSAENFLGIFI